MLQTLYICRKCRELIRTRKSDDEDVLESSVLQEMLGKMTVVCNVVPVCTTETTAAPDVEYGCMQNSSVSRAQLEVAFYEHSN